MKSIDQALIELRQLAEDTGVERINVTVREDGRISVSGQDYRGNSLWWGDADVSTPQSGMISELLPSELVNRVKTRDSRLGAGRPNR